MSILDARKARASQSLDKSIRLDSGAVVTIRVFLDRLRAQGGKLRTITERQYDRVDKVEAQIERLFRNVPFGNPNHPETIAFNAERDRLRAGLDKKRVIVELPSGVFHELKTKAEIDYFTRSSPVAL